MKATRIFLLHTSNRATALTQSLSRNAKAQRGDWLAAQLEELNVSFLSSFLLSLLVADGSPSPQFSLHYAELVLGGRVHQGALMELIIQIVVQVGAPSCLAVVCSPVALVSSRRRGRCRWARSARTCR